MKFQHLGTNRLNEMESQVAEENEDMSIPNEDQSYFDSYEDLEVSLMTCFSDLLVILGLKFITSCVGLLCPITTKCLAVYLKFLKMKFFR